MKALLIFALTVATLQATPIHAAPAVQYADGRITVDLVDADLAEVLAEIARQAKLDVRGTLTAQRLSVRLEAVPLAEALSRLLERQSFALTYDNAGGLKGVRFLGSSTARSAGAPSDGAVSTPEIETPISLAALDHPVPVEGLLAGALGADATNLTTLMSVAMQSGDAHLRADALRVGLGVIDDEPELRAAVLQKLDALDDAALADWLTEAARDHAEEVARQTARISRSGPLRRRAAAVARLLATRAN